MSLNKKIFQGVFWTSLQTVIEQSISFFVKLLLARLLFPEDFGLVGMAVVFTSFVSVFNDVGIGAALVQKKDEDLKASHFHTAFWTGIVWSLFLYIVIALVVSPIAANFYEEPLLNQLIPVLSIGILASPINLVHKAQLTKRLNFKNIALITNSCNIFSGILAVSLAFLGYGVWSLVFNSVASILIAIPLYFKTTGWTPKFVWEKQAFKDIFGFGLYTTGSAVFNNLVSKLDYLLIGKLLSANALGVYTLAFILTDTVKNQVMSMMNKVMYPVYGQIQDNKRSLKSYYLKVVVYNSVLVYPIMIIMLILAEPLINQFFGDKWEDAVLPLQILAVSVMFSLMVNSHTSLIRGMGKPKLEMKIQFFRAIFIFLPALFLGTYYYGMLGAASAVLLNKIFAVVIAQNVLNKLINLSYKELFSALITPLLATLSTISISYFLTYLEILHFSIIALFILVMYFSIIYFRMQKELGIIKTALKNYRKKT